MEEAAWVTPKSRRLGEVRGDKGMRAGRRWGATASGGEDREGGGSEAACEERGVQGTWRKADRRGTVIKVH